MLRFRYLAVFFIFSFVSVLPAQNTKPTSSDVEQRVNAVLSKMSLEQKIDYIGGYHDFYIRAVPEAGVPELKMADGPIGVRNYGESTTLAGGVALAATWDPELAKRAGAVLGEDARARGVHFLLGPGVNIARAPMNGRNFEYFGEDPFLAARTAVGYIEGVQSKKVCATIKHFMANNSEFDRHNTNAIIDERTMREIYLPTFEAAVKQAHVCAIMDSYNLTNGEHLTQNGHLNLDIAKKDWGFDGIIMSDWDATYDGVAAVNNGLDLEMPWAKFMNRATLNPAVAAGKVTEATIDEHVRRILCKAIEFGWLDHDQTDLSISRYNPEGSAVALDAARSSMVLLKNDGGLLPLSKAKVKTLAVIGPDAYPGQPVGGGSAAVRPFHAMSYLEGLAGYLGKEARVTYEQGAPSLMDLVRATAFVTEASGGKPGLTVEHFKTPDLSEAPAEVVTEQRIDYGRDWPGSRWTGYYVATGAGNYGVFLQGPSERARARISVDDKLVLDNWSQATALVNFKTVELSSGPHKVKVEYSGNGGWGRMRAGIFNTASVVRPEAKALAAKADAVVVAVGFDPTSESEGSDRSFRLPPGQDELIQAILGANKNTVVVVTSGGGFDANAWIDRTPALLESWYSGQEGGTALAQLLFGDFSPSGKLPVTFDRHWEDNAVFHNYYPDGNSIDVKYAEGVFLGYRHYDKSDAKPLFPFGYGLSYTTFKYGNLAVTPPSTSGDQKVTVSFDVTNTGKRAGAEVAQVYVSDTHATVPRPVKELKGFSRVTLKPGETRKVTVTLDRRAFSYFDTPSNQWKADPGEFGIIVGSSSAKSELKGKVSLTK